MNDRALVPAEVLGSLKRRAIQDPMRDLVGATHHPVSV
jgi:hypothetical protein